MSEPEKFTEYAAWHDRCRERGDDGPYDIAGSGARRSQFVRRGQGTSAIWNHDAGWGYVFSRDPPTNVQQPTSTCLTTESRNG